MTEPKVMIVIGQVLAEPWLSIARDGQFATWLHDPLPENVLVRHSFGRPPGAVLGRLDRWHEWLRWHGRGRSVVPMIDAFVGRRWLDSSQRVGTAAFLNRESVGWHQAMPDVYALQRWKVLGSLGMAMEEKFDYVYFTTASSYVRIAALVERVHDLPSVGVYAGTPMIDGVSGARFASGASRLMSRDVVEQVLLHRREYVNDVMEDVGLGRLIMGLGYELVPWPSLNVDSFDALENLSDAEIKENFHFRMRSGTRQARQDVPLMKALHQRVQGLEER